MVDDNFTLTTFYDNWKAYQEHIRDAVAPLSAEQLALRAAPGLRSVGENAQHIIGCHAGWFTYVLKEDVGEDVKAYTEWDQRDAPARTPAELTAALDRTWQCMSERLTRWSDADMRVEFEDEWEDGKIVHLSRAWIVWHVMEHDLHHGGELAFTLGIHGLKSEFPG